MVLLIRGNYVSGRPFIIALKCTGYAIALGVNTICERWLLDDLLNLSFQTTRIFEFLFSLFLEMSLISKTVSKAFNTNSIRLHSGFRSYSFQHL